ncbi:MAG: glycosyltransferase [Hyphomonadaceae bacterium]
MRIVMADMGVPFDGHTPQERPLGGAESAFIALAEALAALGHAVEARSAGAHALTERGVTWRPLGDWPQAADFFIANRAPALLSAPLTRRRTAFWLHNPAQFLSKPRYAWPLLRKRPVLVFAGPSHMATAPAWVPDGGRVIIPLGVEAVFLETPPPSAPPPPRAIFTSNPLRGLGRLIELWRSKIRPRAPDAELHVFSGAETYGGAKAGAMGAVLAEARAAAAAGVVVRPPVPKAALAQELAAARVMLYLGDPGETFCLAVAEAQAMGAPAVVRPIGAVGERVINGQTGFVEADEEAFCQRAAALLQDDVLWLRCSMAAQTQRPALTWARAAAQFAQLGTPAPPKAP